MATKNIQNQPQQKYWWENRGQRSTAISALIGIILGSLMTGAVSLSTAALTIRAGEATTNNAITEQRSAESREKRAEIYRAMIAAAEKWRSALGLAVQCKTASSKACPNYATLFAINQAFRDAVRDVYIFGTRNASNAAYALSNTIPDTWPGVGNKLRIPSSIDAQAFSNQFDDFNVLMCKELPAEPRNDC